MYPMFQKVQAMQQTDALVKNCISVFYFEQKNRHSDTEVSSTVGHCPHVDTSDMKMARNVQCTMQD